MPASSRSVVVDSHKAELWKQVFPKLSLHSDVVVREGGGIGWAMRKDSPRLKAALDAVRGKAPQIRLRQRDPAPLSEKHALRQERRDARPRCASSARPWSCSANTATAMPSTGS